jgi:mannose-6-phosphate isomerase-like protein (cupin superfamily)
LIPVELPGSGLMNPFDRPAGAGRTYWGPGDVYTFLVTGVESGGAYFAMEALVPPGSGPPPHIHKNEEETFYIVEGQGSIDLGEEWVLAGAGDFVNVPRGTVHCFHNEGTEAMRMILTFTPAGMERFFEETLQPVLDATQARPRTSTRSWPGMSKPRPGMDWSSSPTPRSNRYRSCGNRIAL